MATVELNMATAKLSRDLHVESHDYAIIVIVENEFLHWPLNKKIQIVINSSTLLQAQRDRERGTYMLANTQRIFAGDNSRRG